MGPVGRSSALEEEHLVPIQLLRLAVLFRCNCHTLWKGKRGKTAIVI